MKLKDLIEKLDDSQIVFVNGTQFADGFAEDILQKEVIRINIETEANTDNLDTLGYSFETGV